MRDVARLAGGVHPSTVSLALRNHPGISEATRKRVRAAARKLGYRPDPLLDAFNTHRLEVLPHKALPVIAFVSDFESRTALEKSPDHRALWVGARQAAEALHCQIELFLVAREQLTPERLHSILRARGISSLVIGACRPITSRLAFDWKDYSAVKIASPHLDVPLYTVASDDRQAARLALRKLKERGCTRIGLAVAREAELQRAGYLLEQAREPSLAGIPLLDPPGNAGVLQAWIRSNRLDGLIAGDASVLLQAEKAGLGIPQELSVALLNVAPEPGAPAGIIHDHTRIGTQAVEQVVSLMRTNQRGLPATSSCTYVPVSWHDGTTAPMRPPAAPSAGF